MRIVTFRRIKEFSAIHADAEVALCAWYHVTSKCEWYTLNDMRNTFGSVDYVGNDRYVFNIKGIRIGWLPLSFLHLKRYIFVSSALMTSTVKLIVPPSKNMLKMTAIKNKQQYEKALERVEELLAVVGNSTPTTDKNFIELDLLSDLVADYEAEHYPVRMPNATIGTQMTQINEMTADALA